MIIQIYDYLHKHEVLRWSILAVCLIMVLLLASRLSYKEDISDFLPLGTSDRDNLAIYQDIAGASQVVAVFDNAGDEEQTTQAIEKFCDVLTVCDTLKMVSKIVSKFDLAKAQERAHILEGLIIASDNIDEVVHIIRAAKSPADAIEGLMQRFELDEIQAKAIVEMRLRQLTGLMQDQLHAEYEEIEKKIAFYELILSDEEVCRKVIKDELIEVKEKYGDERKTEISLMDGDINPEDYYPDDEVVITISHLGYIKCTPLHEFRTQNRGGVGSKGSNTRNEDFVEHIYPATMHNTMMFFTQKGRCYWLKVYQIPMESKTSKGRAIQNLLNIEPDDKVTAYLRVKNLADAEFNNSHYIVFCTKNGTIKKTSLAEYSRPRQNGVNAINILEGDKVIEVRLTDGDNEIIMANKNGRAIRFNETLVRPMGRTATGVRGMRTIARPIVVLRV